MAESRTQPNKIIKGQSGLSSKLIRLYNLKKSIKSLNDQYDELKESTYKQVREHMANNGNDPLTFSYNYKQIKVTNVVRRKVIFNPDALENKLGKEFCREFISREYQITDWDKMVKLLKSKGIKPNEFLPFIKVEKRVDNSKIDQMESLGDITREELEGTYEVKEVANFFQMDELDTE